MEKHRELMVRSGEGTEYEGERERLGDAKKRMGVDSLTYRFVFLETKLRLSVVMPNCHQRL